MFQGGNPTCPDGLADAGSTSISNTDLQGGYTDGRISITRRGVVNGIDSFDWVIADHSVDIMAVIVKGGDGAYIYFYDSLGGSWGDNNLAPPLNNGGQAPQISHAVFCYDPKDAPNPVLSVEKSASGSSEITHSWKVDKQVKPAGAADSAYGDNTVLNLPDGGNGSVTWKVTVTQSQVQTYAVNGTITVKNDGAVAVTGVDVSDSILGAVIDCGGNGSTGITVPANGSVDCSYTVTPDSEVPNNTATVTWGEDSSKTATATIAWADPDRARHSRARRRRRQRGRDARRGRPHEQRMDDDLQRAVDLRERQAVAEQRPDEHGGRHVERRVGQRQR